MNSRLKKVIDGANINEFTGNSKLTLVWSIIAKAIMLPLCVKGARNPSAYLDSLVVIMLPSRSHVSCSVATLTLPNAHTQRELK